MDVAERVFLAKGYAETKMQDVATEAGASKETLYRHFGSKKALFAELMEARTLNLRDRLRVSLSDEEPIDVVLKRLGMSLVEVVISEEMISFSKLASSEAHRDPSIDRLVYSIGLNKIVEILAGYLRSVQRVDRFVGRDPDLCARIFLGALLSFSQFPDLLQEGKKSLTRNEIDRMVNEVVLLFTTAYAALSSPV